MAKFTQATLSQVAGFDAQVLAQNLVYQQKDFWNFAWTSTTQVNGWTTDSDPVDLTGATINATIVRRAITDFNDSRTGLDFNIYDYPLVSLITTITASDATDDTFTCTSTADLFIDQPVRFTGAVFGNVVINTTYFVKTIITSTTFTISATFLVPSRISSITSTSRPTKSAKASIAGASSGNPATAKAIAAPADIMVADRHRSHLGELHFRS